MDGGGILTQRLSQYFDGLLGDTITTNTSHHTKNTPSPKHHSPLNACEEPTELHRPKKRKKKLKETTTRKDIKDTNAVIDIKNLQNNSLKNSHKSKGDQPERAEEQSTADDSKGVTDDGFKIVSSIPEDDSDVSDAFESCEEEEDEYDDPVCYPRERQPKLSPSKPRQTDDGFKIVSEIPADDSDVSDAFEEDDDDEDGDDDGFVSASSSPKRKKKIKKSLMQIMDDFGIDDKTVLDSSRDRKAPPKQPLKLSKKQRKLKNRQSNTMTYAAAQGKRQEAVQVLDYAKKRGANKDSKKNKQNEEEEEVKDESVESKRLDEKELKRVRYDVFKLGMSGFHKEKKQDTRVELAIKLGAKPPKKKAVNYKTLQDVKKGEKKKEAEEKEMKRKLGVKIPKPFKKKDRAVVKAGASQIGRYTHGIQVLSRRDIAKVNKS